MARSIADFLASLDPRHRIAQRRADIEEAKLYQQAQQHAEQMALQQQKMQADQQREVIAGENARALSLQNFLLNEMGKETDLAHFFLQHQQESQREWDSNILAIQKSLFEIEADTTRQQKLQKQLHQQELEKMQLEYFLKSQESQQTHRQNIEIEKLKNILSQRFAQQQQNHKIEELQLNYYLQSMAKILDNKLQNYRITYDGLNNIIMLLIARILGLNGEAVSDDDIAQFVDEAIAQAQP